MGMITVLVAVVTVKGESPQNPGVITMPGNRMETSPGVRPDLQRKGHTNPADNIASNGNDHSAG